VTVSIAWFSGLFLATLAVFWLGRRLGRGSARVETAAVAAVVALIFGAAALRFRPALLPAILGLDLAVWLDGILPVFPWMALAGLVHVLRRTRRMRRLAELMAVFGLVYFLFGAIWMILPVIQVGEVEKIGDKSRPLWLQVTIQNRPDTCAPSSAATALRAMGVPASEERMCGIVQAKPTRGSSLIRTARGLRDYLESYQITVEVRNSSAAEVVEAARRDRPALAIIRSTIAADHMVAVLGRVEDVYGPDVPGSVPGAVLIANPSPGEHGGVKPLDVSLPYGEEAYSPEDFARLYRRGVIVFRSAH
jgi:hypothetical protein